ncbi:tetrathionate reductase family octaheme c-type cytochrome [uncultured Cohaesibacter sp.]|uniref:tetrathionate reductase family octaheme c-type cytochrome n=1 Tax=uncultured Cohaesibacter sp. TaxID=1002546 RepID=UPI0029C6E952|nr:tetrathionate reductase family octaheme c-type cytochrome [uncultured Cohaesibacter sp.]
MTDRAKPKRLETACKFLFAAALISFIPTLSGLTSLSGTARAASDAPASTQPTPTPAAQITGKKPGETADHTKFEILQQEFKSAPEVTKACLTCHTEAATQVHDSIHWKWEYDNTKTGQKLGKRYVINAFCGNVASNEARCTSCHAGYGWKDMRQAPPSEPDKVDCLVCHAEKKYYRKFPTMAGLPVTEPTKFQGKDFPVSDLNKAAQSVSLPQRENCGVCHFYGGGGDGVKHGDLDSSLHNPSKDLDVHMSADAGNMACSACHSGSGHKWPGSRYDMEAKPDTRTEEGKKVTPFKLRYANETASCESCHSDAPHQGKSLTAIKLNNHTDTVACQTCHIPEFARGGVATKMLWDWSTAGQLKDGKPFTVKDDKGHPKYDSKKGDFLYEENVKPTYAWFNGKFTYVTDDDPVDTSKPVVLNELGGQADDKDARIWPFKLMHTKQPIDAESKKLVYMHLFGKDANAFWKTFDWPKAIESGMDFMDKPYSGKFEFIETRMWWPITHMVAPASKAVQCDECHTKNGRLEGIEGVLIPGRDNSGLIDWLGYGLIILTIIGVGIHTAFRIATRNKRKS